MTKRTKQTAALGITVTALLSGLVCYRVGLLFTGCSSLSSSTWSMQTIKEEEYKHESRPNYNIRHETSSSSSPQRRHHVTDDDLPYNCGVVFFYHIPSTGGASINTWLRKYSNSKNGFGYSYFQHWEADFNGKKSKDIATVVQRSERKFMEGMNEHVQNLKEDEWRIAHGHINSLHINETEHLLYKWRSTIEEQGCHMINTVMLREPLSHTISLHKVIQRKNSTWGEWVDYLNAPVGRGLWATNLDFLLYNKGRRNEYNVSKEEKVQRAMQILDEHFDVVTVGNHSLFMSMVLDMTGWEYIKMPYTNSFKGELVFTKKRVENLQKLLAANGDIEFIDAVKQRYHGYLSYLDDD